MATQKQVHADNTNNSSNNIVVYKFKKLDELNMNLGENKTCIRLFSEMSNMINENIALAKRRHELDMHYVDIMKDCTRNNLPQSVCQERTQ